MVGNASRPRGFAVFRVGKHDVDVGGNVEFGSSEFAHGNHVQLLRRARHGPEGIAKIPRQPLRVDDSGHRHGFFGQRGDGFNHFSQIGATIEIADDQAQHYDLAPPAQRGMQRLLVRVLVRHLRTHPATVQPAIERDAGHQIGFGAHQVARVTRQPHCAGDGRGKVFRRAGAGSHGSLV